ncbi:hypothetical protein TNCV_4473201 [Trichonephila clavipes]|uniref:Uncharacterized protein n=1 Tax=Trichonephila clavipes TaxID=2585209 RepID=A0A8X6SLN1_TRICX|nr:hypothetical protein TNCV_4473201 [Trichonephila clavipes]
MHVKSAKVQSPFTRGMWKFGEDVPTQVLLLSLDHGSESRNSSPIALKRYFRERNCPSVSSEEFTAEDDDNIYTAPIRAEKDILEHPEIPNIPSNTPKDQYSSGYLMVWTGLIWGEHTYLHISDRYDQNPSLTGLVHVQSIKSLKPTTHGVGEWGGSSQVPFSLLDHGAKLRGMLPIAKVRPEQIVNPLTDYL